MKGPLQMKSVNRALALSLLCIASHALSGAETFRVAVVGNKVVVSGASSGGAVTLLGGAHQHLPFMMRIVDVRTLLVDDDHDGIVTYEVADGVPHQSLWIATDIATGLTALGVPTGYTPILLQQRSPEVGNPVNIAGNVVDIDRDRADIIVVRPGAGAWTLPVRLANRDSAPHAAGRSAVPLVKFQPLRASFGDAPPALRNGDVVAIIDATRLEYLITTVQPGNS